MNYFFTLVLKKRTLNFLAVLILGMLALPANAVNLPATGSITNGCGNNISLYPNNGSASNYSDNDNAYIVLQGGGYSTINISGSYQVETGYDYIYIYDGVGTGGALLATYNGTGTINYTGAAGHSLTLQFTSDVSVNYYGFALNITYSGSCSYPCYGSNWGSGGNTYVGSGITCSNQTFNIPSTSYFQFDGTAGVNYTFQLSGAPSWTGGYYMSYWEYNGSSWILKANSGGTNPWQVVPTTTSPAGGGYNLITVYNGTACPPAWPGANSAVLNYQITTPSTPAITQNPVSGSHVCNGGGVSYTATGISVGSFNQFLYGWGSAGSNPLGIGNGASWTSSNPGNTLYVVAQSKNGSCTANSSVATVTVDAASNAGSFVTSPIYSCFNSGTTYNAAGVATSEAITGYTGTITGWGYGSNTSTCTANTTGYPASAGSATTPYGCCFGAPGNATVMMVGVTNGACPTAYNCITPTYNTLVNPTSGSVTGSVTGNSTGCPSNGNITLACSGGNTGVISGGKYQWYSGSCGGTAVGVGSSLTIAAPASTTSYYVQAQDVCGGTNCYGPITYTVTPNASIASVTGTSALCIGATATYSANGVVTGGGTGTWSSDNTAVATVNSSGLVTAVAAGTCNIKYSISGGCGSASAQQALTVSALPVVSVTGPTSFCGGTTTTLSPSTGGTWVSNNTAAATVSGNTVTGTTAGGSATFTFTTTASPNCAATTSAVTVTGLPTVYGVTGGGTYCYGSSTTVSLNNSQTGVNYQLVLNGSTNVGSPIPGTTGNAITFTNVTAVGTYTVIGTTVTNSCSQAMSGSTIVNMLTPNVTNNPGATGVGTNGGTLNGTD